MEKIKGKEEDREAKIISRKRNRANMHDMVKVTMGHGKWDNTIF